MNFHVLTVFPEMIETAARFGVVGQALKEGRLSLSARSPREFTSNVHQTIDDRPFGGGDGMVMIAEPMAKALELVLQTIPAERRRKVIHLSPRGTPLTDAKARELAGLEDLVLVTSRYGGIDQRFLNHHVDEELSVGDYILSGGELAALVVIDAVSRHVAGVLGNVSSAEDESFSPGRGWLEQPQFSRPRVWEGEEVPEALLSGHHAKIEEWEALASLLVTAGRRPDLLGLPANGSAGRRPTERETRAALALLDKMPDTELNTCGIRSRSAVESVLRALLSPVARASTEAK